MLPINTDGNALPNAPNLRSHQLRFHTNSVMKARGVISGDNDNLLKSQWSADTHLCFLVFSEFEKTFEFQFFSLSVRFTTSCGVTFHTAWKCRAPLCSFNFCFFPQTEHRNRLDSQVYSNSRPLCDHTVHGQYSHVDTELLWIMSHSQQSNMTWTWHESFQKSCITCIHFNIWDFYNDDM